MALAEGSGIGKPGDVPRLGGRGLTQRGPSGASVEGAWARPTPPALSREAIVSPVHPVFARQAPFLLPRRQDQPAEVAPPRMAAADTPHNEPGRAGTSGETEEHKLTKDTTHLGRVDVPTKMIGEVTEPQSAGTLIEKVLARRGLYPSSVGLQL